MAVIILGKHKGPPEGLRGAVGFGDGSDIGSSAVVHVVDDQTADISYNDLSDSARELACIADPTTVMVLI